MSAAQSRTVLPCERKTCDSLPMVVVLPVPFTPTTRITSGVPSTFVSGRAVVEVRIASSSSFEQALQFVYVFDLLAIGLVAELLENFVSGGGAEVGADQRGFQVVEGGAVDFFADGDDVLDAFSEVLARARDRLLHAIEKTGLLDFVQAAEEGLNHECVR